MHTVKSITRWLRLALAGSALIGLLGTNWVITHTSHQARQRLAFGAAQAGLGLNDLWNPSQANESAAVEAIYPVAFGSVSLKEAVANAATNSLPVVADEQENFPFATKGAAPFAPDAALQNTVGPEGPMPNPVFNFYGLWSGDNSASLAPPDTNGDIGYDPTTDTRYYIQWVNLVLQIWDVSVEGAPFTLLSSPAQGNVLWSSGLPNSFCASYNDGDPIVLFDEQAQRWFISQFAVNDGAGPFHQCIAVSQTPDPTGYWWVWDYLYSNTEMNDYPHFGVWPDPTYNAYFMTVHEFALPNFDYSGQGVVAFERAKLLVGDPSAAMVRVDLFGVNPDFYGLLPADMDGGVPASGTPGFFFSVTDSAWIAPSDALRIWEFRPNWSNTPASTFGVGGQPNYTMNVAAFNLPPCMSTPPYNSCVPQPNTSIRLDSLGGTLMYRAAFRNMGSHQAVLLNHTVWADSTDRLGVRWYEVRRNVSNGSWSIYQQSTYAPTDGLYRWMGSMAMDKNGNIALGYSVANGSTYPSIRYVGRLAGDTLNTMAQTEVSLYSGSGSQTNSRRWGDYSMMGISAEDGCTFWYTQEFYGSSWDTRIGAFRFPAGNCTPYNRMTYVPFVGR